MSSDDSHPGLLLRLVVWYQQVMEGRPSPCRFTPSCSSYAREALEVHGRWYGAWLAMRRLVRCRPFGPSGFDPVPEARGAESSVTSTADTGGPR